MEVIQTVPNNYWTAMEQRLLAEVKSFDEMVPVALEILDRMSKQGDHIIQICGPMSTGGLGSLRANMTFFQRAQKVAIGKGWLVFDQSPFEGAIVRLEREYKESKATTAYCFDILHIFYRGVFASKKLRELCFLPKWETSIGTTWEREEAANHDLIVSEYPSEWLELIPTN